MDDLFGLAAAEGPMRIGRRRKKKAVATEAAPEASQDAKKPAVNRGNDTPPHPIPKLPSPTVKPSGE